jgi:hypothetical protein
LASTKEEAAPQSYRLSSVMQQNLDTEHNADSNYTQQARPKQARPQQAITRKATTQKARTQVEEDSCSSTRSIGTVSSHNRRITSRSRSPPGLEPRREHGTVRSPLSAPWSQARSERSLRNEADPRPGLTRPLIDKGWSPTESSPTMKKSPDRSRSILEKNTKNITEANEPSG